MTHKLTAAKVDKPATLPQRSAAASRNEMATDVAGAENHPPSEFISGFRKDIEDIGCIYRTVGNAMYEEPAERLACRTARRAWDHAYTLRTANAELVKACKLLIYFYDFVRPGGGALDADVAIARNLIAKHGGAANV